MRHTTIERLEARRLEDYDPDYHGMLDCDGGVQVNVTRVDPGSLRLRFNFQHIVKRRDTGAKFGLVEGSAVSQIRDPAISSEAIGREGMNLPEHIEKLIEGAYAQDVMLPVSHMAAAMRLPIPLISPIDFTGMFRVKSKARQSHLPEPTATSEA